MSATCVNGHASATTDYCDQCGVPIAAATTVLPAVEEVEEVDTSAAAPAQPCPECGALRSGDDRYCEGCGHDFLAPPRTGWAAVVSADRRQFERVAPPGLAFPADYRERRIALDGAVVRIGRSKGESVPEIDLREDPGVSSAHAVLERRDDGGYAVRDVGSTNGTTINDDPEPIGAETSVALAEGDRIRVGAWTTITVSAR